MHSGFQIALRALKIVRLLTKNRFQLRCEDCGKTFRAGSSYLRFCRDCPAELLQAYPGLFTQADVRDGSSRRLGSS
jgi:hypothetical protein